jgi:hypothetical protein
MFTRTSLLATALLLAAAPAFAEGAATPAPTLARPAVTSQAVSPDTAAQTAKPTRPATPATVTGHAASPERHGEAMRPAQSAKAPDHVTGSAPVRSN